jgi:transcriptional regulator with PAS, ATPase and Fis domain
MASEAKPSHQGQSEAELFGFEAGASTDARRPKPGLFEAASGGMLFLDEIDTLPLQAKLLKASEGKRVRRLGVVAEHAVDVKLIWAGGRRDGKY